MKKRLAAIIMTVVTCVSIMAVAASAVEPRWANVNDVTTSIDPSGDTYVVAVEGVSGTTKIEINATLKEKNIFGIYVEKDTASGTYNSRYGTLIASYDMSTNKDYKVTAVIYVTANGVREKIEV